MSVSKFFKYKAFISYSHSEDITFAPELQRGLHRFAKPWYQLRAIRTFRDETNLAATPQLWTTIQQALHESEFFLLLASPTAAKSKWVNDEVETWLTIRPWDSMIIAQTDGEIVWDSKIGDFDRKKTTAIPTKLFGQFEDEPLVIDFRSIKEEQLSIRSPGFLRKVAKISARLRSLDLDDIIGKDVAEFRRSRSLARGAVFALVILTILTIGGAIWANIERNKAREELYFSSIDQAYGLLSERSLVEAMRNLARAPSEYRSWEWKYVLNRIGFAPIEIEERDLEVLKADELNGTGIFDAAQSLFQRDSHSERIMVSASGLKIESFGPTRSFGHLDISDAESGELLSRLSIPSYARFGDVWVAPDRSCILLKASMLSKATHRIGRAAAGLSSNVAGEEMSENVYDEIVDEVERYKLYILPVDSTRRVSASLGSDAPLPHVTWSGPYQSGESRVLFKDIGAKSRIVVVDFKEENMHMNELPFKEGDSLDLPGPLLSIVFSLPEKERGKAIDWLDARTPGGEKVRNAVGWKRQKGRNWIVTCDREGRLEFVDLQTLSPKEIVLESEEAKESWKAAAEHLPYGILDVGASFSSDGERLLLCPFDNDSAYILDLDDFSPECRLRGRFMGMNAYARAASPTWGFSDTGRYAFLISEDTATLRNHFVICDALSGELLLQRADTRIAEVGWLGEDQLFAWREYDADSVFLQNIGSGKIEKVFQGGNRRANGLIDESPKRFGRMLIGSTLVRRSDLRPILTFRHAFELGAEWDWVVTVEENKEIEVDQPSIVHFSMVESLNDRKISIRSRIGIFQIRMMMEGR